MHSSNGYSGIQLQPAEACFAVKFARHFLNGRELIQAGGNTLSHR
jgi:hypothetical protein